MSRSRVVFRECVCVSPSEPSYRVDPEHCCRWQVDNLVVCPFAAEGSASNQVQKEGLRLGSGKALLQWRLWWPDECARTGESFGEDWRLTPRPRNVQLQQTKSVVVKQVALNTFLRRAVAAVRFGDHARRDAEPNDECHPTSLIILFPQAKDSRRKPTHHRLPLLVLGRSVPAGLHIA